MLFASYLAQQGLAHATIEVYLYPIHNPHLSSGLHQKYTQQLTPRLEMVLQGIEKNYLRTAQHRIHFPIIQNIMCKIRSILHQRQSTITIDS